MVVQNIMKNGIGYVILDTTDNIISGIYHKVDSVSTFSMPLSDMLFMINANMIEFVEILPSYIIKDYKKQYKNNLSS